MLSSKFQLPRADTHTRFILALGMGANSGTLTPKIDPWAGTSDRAAVYGNPMIFPGS